LYNYYIVDAKIGKEEVDLIKFIRKIISGGIPKELDIFYVKNKKYGKILDAIVEIFGENNIPPKDIDKNKFDVIIKRLKKESDENFKKALYFSLFELGKISYLIEDEELEEIMINGINKNIFVFHSRYGMCETNLMVEDEDEMNSLIKKIIVKSNIYEMKEIIDGKLYDGSRINITMPPLVEEPCITIRKFRKRQYNILELIIENTINLDVASFLWLCVDGFGIYPQNMIISGGTFSGKTTLLNALSIFIPKHERIISIEDTYELNLIDKKNWIKLRTNEKYSIKNLIKDSLRMRPDRILVGEVRGEEAKEMFVSMDVGARGVMCTLHANNPHETIIRLRNDPMNVPDAMFTLLNLIVTIQKINVPGKGVKRRVISVAEVKRTEDNILLNELYKYDHNKDELIRTEIPSQIIEDIAKIKGFNKMDIFDELENRKKFLEKLIEKNAKIEDLIEAVNKYYIVMKTFEN
jgi:flagellar protein FlaI